MNSSILKCVLVLVGALLGMACASRQSQVDLSSALSDSPPACNQQDAACQALTLGDHHTISLPADRIFLGASAVFRADADRTLLPLALSIRDHKPRWVSVGVVSSNSDQDAVAVRIAQARALVAYLTKSNVQARLLYENTFSGEDGPGLNYFDGVGLGTPEVKIAYDA